MSCFTPFIAFKLFFNLFIDLDKIFYSPNLLVYLMRREISSIEKCYQRVIVTWSYWTDLIVFVTSHYILDLLQTTVEVLLSMWSWMKDEVNVFILGLSLSSSHHILSERVVLCLHFKLNLQLIDVALCQNFQKLCTFLEINEQIVVGNLA